MGWSLFLDDDSEHRFPENFYQDCRVFIICRTIEEAKLFVETLGMPEFMSLDHDLGGEDTAIVFLKWLANEYWDGKAPVPDYKIHSANPVGQQNILSFMESWKRVVIERLRYDEDGYLILQGNLFEKPQLRVGDLCAYVGRQECIEDTYIILKIQNYHGNGVGATIYNCQRMTVSNGFVRLEYNVILAHADDL